MMKNKSVDLSEIHKIELEMLKAVAVICDRYNLRYFIYCGTLLGAVRHKGFIPWDDDIDLAMPLADYRRFLEHTDELPAQFVCVHRDNTRSFSKLWIRIQANETTFMRIEFAGVDIHHGLFMDIYPMIGTPKSPLLSKIQSLLLFIASKLQVADFYSVMLNPGCLRSIIAHIPYFVRRTVTDLILWLCMIDPNDSEYVGTIDAAPFEGKFKWEDWNELIMLPFENELFRAPAQYNKILRRIYGNYMKLPPEEKRIGHFKDDMIIDPHRDYRLYRKELLGK